MKSMFSLYMLLFVNLLGVFMVMSSSSWVGVWFGLELSGFSFPPLLMLVGYSKISLINCWKYILIQSYCSCVMMIGFFSFSFSGLYFMNSYIQWFALLVMVFVKIGLPPFHGWMMHISNSMSWCSFLVLSTIQKLGPMILLSHLMVGKENNCEFELLYLFVMLFSISGAFVCCIRFFLVNSSSLNISWMMSVIYMSKYVMFFYMIVYFMHVMMLISVFSNSFDLSSSMFYVSRMSFMSNFIVQLIVYSMIGIPPLIGFFMKTLLVSILVEQTMTFVCSLMLLLSGLFSFVYITLVVNCALKEKMELFSADWKSTSFLLSLMILMFWLFWFFS